MKYPLDVCFAVDFWWVSSMSLRQLTLWGHENDKQMVDRLSFSLCSKKQLNLLSFTKPDVMELSV